MAQQDNEMHVWMTGAGVRGREARAADFVKSGLHAETCTIDALSLLGYYDGGGRMTQCLEL